MIRECFRKAYRMMQPMIYAKSKYKLFMGSVGKMDDKVRELALAKDFFSSVITPVLVRPPFGNAMLVIAPHQDDEIIGCGGALCLQREKQKKAEVVFLQDGGDEHEEDGLTRDELITVREKESCEAAKKLGISQPCFLRHKNLDSRNLEIVADQLKEILIKIRPTSIFAPFFLDHNHDHRFANKALALALKNTNAHCTVFGYEVWGLCIANVAVVIDSVMKRKQDLLSCYTSQLKGTDYINSVTGINMYHSRRFGAGTCSYVENFFESPVKEYIDIVSRIYQV